MTVYISKEKIINDEPRKNEEIRISNVRLIDENGEQVGIVSNQEAQNKASAAGLDLIEIAANVKPPVCRIMDYGKYKYDKEKKLKESRRNQHQTKLKEIKFTPRISDHDYGYRREQAKKFLTSGDRVKASVFFKGREMAHVERGRVVLEKLIQELEGIAQVDKNIIMQGKLMSIILVPAKK